MFGNDSAAVDTKSDPRAAFGNDAIGFIRVRKRKLRGGHPDWRAYRASHGALVIASVSFDLVRAVRVDGKPRHQFVLGLGSQKNVERYGYCRFWVSAIYRMTRHRLSEPQRQRLMAEMVRKGAQLPSNVECEQHVAAGSEAYHQSAIDELCRFIRTADAATP